MDDWTTKRKSTHIVICTAIGKGHFTPAVMLSRKLTSLGISITLVTPDDTVSSLISSSTLCQQGADILVTSLTDSSRADVFSVQMAGVRVGIPSGFELKFDLTLQQQKLEDLLRKMKSSPSPPACLIVDMMLTWTEDIASKLQIPRFVLFPGAPNQLPLFLHMKSLYQEQRLLPIPHDNPQLKKRLFDSLQLPGLPMPIRWYDIPDAITDNSHTLHEMHMGWLNHLQTCDGILFNTFLELEGNLFDALKTNIPKPILLPIGPLLPEDHSKPVLPSSQEEHCQQWLDSQPETSVVYISFGSYAVLAPKQIQELALGIERSQQRFLWVLPVGKFEFLPAEFVERNSGKGLVISGWAPQHLILSHSSLGAFLTHCGWNSTLECVALGGVAMIGWPFFVDQQPNCRYIVDGLGIGVDVHADDEGFVSSEEVERALTSAMAGPHSQVMRKRAQILKAAAKKSVEEGGSSFTNMRTFVARFS